MIVNCPNCVWSANVPDEEIRASSGRGTCPNCSTKFSIMLEQEETKRCLFCGEKVLAVAKKCKHCGETIDIILRTAEEARRSSENSNVYMNAGGGTFASATESDTDSATVCNPLTEQPSPFFARKQGKLTTIGFLGIALGLLITITGFDMAKNGVPNGMIPFGLVLMICVYLRARKEEKSN